jgi:hypothetical protein
VKNETVQLEEIIGADIKTLRSSPLFQLSLGSKELFHSNFLAWLFETYPEESGRALSRFIKDDTGNVAIDRVLREQKNRDLTIYFRNGQELVIENKVKSLPYIEQLEMYSDGAEANQNFLLLSLMSPPFSVEGVVKAGRAVWNTLTYSDLPTVIKQIGSGVTNEYHRAILSDYISFASSLGGIFASNSYSENDLFADFHSPSKGSAFEQLQPLRMGDIYQKLRYESLASRIYEVLANVYPGLVVLSDTRDGEREVGHMYVSHGMSNSQGMVTVSYLVAKGLYLTVQIQGGSYRQMVQGYAGYGKASRGVAERLKSKRLWFDFSDFADAKEYPRGTKEFNTFGDIDFYRSVKLDLTLTVRDVIDLVIRDMRKIVDNKCDIAVEV